MYQLFLRNLPHPIVNVSGFWLMRPVEFSESQRLATGNRSKRKDVFFFLLNNGFLFLLNGFYIDVSLSKKTQIWRRCKKNADLMKGDPRKQCVIGKEHTTSTNGYLHMNTFLNLDFLEERTRCWGRFSLDDPRWIYIESEIEVLLLWGIATKMWWKLVQKGENNAFIPQIMNGVSK